MPKKYVIIETSKVTQAMRNLSNKTVDYTIMTALGGDAEDMGTELAAVNDDFWTSSDSSVVREGDTTDALVLPKEALG